MTPGRDSHPALAAARESGIVPLMSSADPDVLWRAAEAIVEAGLGIMEVVFRAPGTARALARVIERAQEAGLPLTIGAGTVLSVTAADAAIGAGARFVFSPALSGEVGSRCIAAGVAWFPGCATPTEVHTALELGCDAVKLFPADALGGPGFVRSLRSVFPAMNPIPSGGIVPTEEELRAWFRAGAVAVGVGSWLFPSDAAGSHDWSEVSRRLATASTAVSSARVEAGK